MRPILEERAAAPAARGAPPAVGTLLAVAPSDVYGTARGQARARIASPIAARARARRHAEFFGLTGLEPGMRVLDVGCGTMGLRALEPGLEITGVDLYPRPTYPGPFLQADVTEGLPYADGEFDLVYSSSVVEHVPRARRDAFAAETRRVGRGLYVQTPAYSFPVEPHSLLPLAHWLPARARKRYWRLGAQGFWEDIDLLTRTEMARLFGATVHAERLGPLAKSWIAIDPVTPR
jgi:SAM-dependent methyltransferase